MNAVQQMLIVAKMCNFTSQGLLKKQPPGDTETDISLRAVLLSYHSDSDYRQPKTQIFPVVLKNVFPPCLGSPGHIKMEERTNRLI